MSSNLLIMVAMAAEAAPTIARLSLKQTPFPSTKLPYLLYTGTHNSTPITLCTLGSNKFGVDNVGTLHAGIALSHLLESAEMPYTAVLNVGTCGGFKAQGCSIGTVVLPTSSAFHDRRIVIPGTPFEDYGLFKLSHAPALTSLDAISGHCTTGDSLDHCAEDDTIMAAHNAAAKDMEFAALAVLADVYSVPLIGVKVVTDLVDGDRPSHEEFMENLGTAAVSLQKTVEKAIEELAK